MIELKTHYGKNGQPGGPYAGDTACGRYLKGGPVVIRPYIAIASYDDLHPNIQHRYPKGCQERLPTCKPCAKKFIADRDYRRKHGHPK